MPDRTDIEIKLGVLQAWVIGGAMFVLTLVITGIFAVAYVIVHQNHKANSAIACYIEAQSERARAAIPSIAYYKNHPGELANALAQIDEQLAAAHDAFGTCDHH